MRYHRHLIRLQKGSVEGSDKSIWLCEVLDHFALELMELGQEPDLEWRSTSHHPLLVRAFGGADDFDVDTIKRAAAGTLNIRVDDLTLKKWEQWYIDVDLVHKCTDELWDDILCEDAGVLQPTTSGFLTVTDLT